MPASLRSATSTSLGHLSPAVEPGHLGSPPSATATPVSSGSHGQRAAGTCSGATSTENVSAARGGVTQPRPSRPAAGGLVLGDQTRPAGTPPGPARRRRRWCSRRPSTTSTVRHQRAGLSRRRSDRRNAGCVERGTVEIDGRAPALSLQGPPVSSPRAARPEARRGTEVPDDIDIHTTAGKLADLGRRLDEAIHAGSARAVEKQHARGKQTARERIDQLLDEDSFVEIDELARHRSRRPSAWRSGRPYGDGVVTGYGTVDGRQVCVFAQDFTVFGGSLGEVFGEKICKVMDLAISTGCPLVGINEGAGARIQEGVVSLGLYGEIFRRNVHASGVIPQISLIMGAVRRRARLLPRAHRLHRDGRPDLAHVHHRSGRDQDRHRRGRDVRGPRRRAHAQHQVGQRPLHGRRRGRRPRLRQGAARLPAAATTSRTRPPSTRRRCSR